MCTHSNEINELAAALSKAQAEIHGAAKDTDNPFFKSKYADLSSVWDACREPLTKNNLAVTQGVSANGPVVTVTTILMHASGQWVRSELSVTAKDATPQSVGSATTYCRRYALAAISGVAPEDDDGEAAQPRDQGKKKAEPAKPADKPATPPPETAEYRSLANKLHAMGIKTPDDATAVINYAVAGVGKISDMRTLKGECEQIEKVLTDSGKTGAEILEAIKKGNA